MFSKTPRFATDLVETAAMKAADWVVATLPESRKRRPTTAPPARIVAHRGAWKERGCPENTLAAFRRARECGVWGLEFDVRFTKDDVAVIHHDETLLRTYGRPLSINHITHKTLRHEAPEVPTLEDVLREYSGAMHLMIEIKGRHAEFSGTRLKRIAELLKPLKVDNYHLMSLEPTMLEVLSDHVGIERRALVSIAKTNTQEISDLTLARNYGAFTCHYATMSTILLQRHHSALQKCGVGFAESKSSLHREWARGVDWIFTNYAHEAMNWLRTIESSHS